MAAQHSPVQTTSKDVKKRDLLRQYGIICVSVEYFQYGGFRYPNLEEAVSQAKRDQYAHESDI